MANIPKTGISPLTEDQKRRVDELWGWTGLKPSYHEMEMFNHYKGFDPHYLTHYQYLPVLAHALNNYRWTKLFEHKALNGCLATGAIKFPKVYIRSVSGELYDEDMRQISYDEAVNICAKVERLVVKNAAETSGGDGVRIVNGMDVPNELKVRNRDFVVQECLRQHESLAMFNKSSINTLRVTTLYLNGKFSTLSIILRIGRNGSSVDNWGAGGIIIGVNEDGSLHELGYDIKMKEYRQQNGVVFRDVTLSQVPSLLGRLEESHSTQFSLCKFIGWDIAFNEHNEPVCLELNSSQPGVIGEQLCTGPIFGNRFDEVVKYCSNRI